MIVPWVTLILGLVATEANRTLGGQPHARRRLALVGVALGIIAVVMSTARILGSA